MIKAHKLVLYADKTHHAYTQEEVEGMVEQVIKPANVELVELYFANDWCYKPINKFGPKGWYSDTGIFQFEKKLRAA